MSTRPRISINKNGSCNACVWSKEKVNFNWSSRERELKKLLKKHKNKSSYDCVIPVSGGKDGSYVTDRLINKYNLNKIYLKVILL